MSDIRNRLKNFLLVFATFTLVSTARAELSLMGSAGTEPHYFVGSGDVAEFAIDVVDLKAILYLTWKTSGEPLTQANVSIDVGKDPIRFKETDEAGVYSAQLNAATDLPNQIIISSSNETDAIEPTVPAYKRENSKIAPAKEEGTLLHLIFVLFLGVVLGGTFVFLFTKHKISKWKATFRQLGITVIGISILHSQNAFAHAGHDHGGTSAAEEAPSGGEIVLPKKSQLLIGLRTVIAKSEAVPKSEVGSGHVIPKPQNDAMLVAPQSGFLRGIANLSIGKHVKRGETLGFLQNISSIRLDSPIDGELVEIFPVEGGRVEAGAKLFRVTNSSILWVDAELFSSQIGQIKDSDDILVAVNGYAEPIKAKKLDVVTAISEETRTAKVFVELQKPPTSLRIGSFAEVAFLAANKDGPGIVIPASAVLNRSGDLIVFVQTGPETFVARNITLGDTSIPNKAVITHGISESERIVVSGNYQLLLKAK